MLLIHEINEHVSCITFVLINMMQDCAQISQV